MAIRVFHVDESEARLSMIAQDARLIVWPGVGAWQANMNYVRMTPGEANRPHVHATSEDTIFVLAGEGTIEDLTNGGEHVFGPGQAVHVPAGVRHRVRADRDATIESVGGPCPADADGLRAAGVLGEDDGPPAGGS